MRRLVILLAAATALLGLGYAFQANATMSVLQRPADTFSPVENADCVEQGFFWPKGSTLPRQGARWPELKLPPAQPNSAPRAPATEKQITRYASLAPMAGTLRPRV